MTLEGSEVVSLVPRDSGEGTLEFTCVRSSVRWSVRSFICHGFFSFYTEPFWLKIGIQYPQYPYYLEQNHMEAFFGLAPLSIQGDPKLSPPFPLRNWESHSKADHNKHLVIQLNRNGEPKSRSENSFPGQNGRFTGKWFYMQQRGIFAILPHLPLHISSLRDN